MCYEAFYLLTVIEMLLEAMCYALLKEQGIPVITRQLIDSGLNMLDNIKCKTKWDNLFYLINADTSVVYLFW